jgi:tRNA(Ile)-lysidine synthetase-like protein
MKSDPIPAGTYVLAVSGGIDSVALLHVLKDQLGLQLVVAHYDHGIRSDSADDKVFVEQLAAEYGLKFVSERGELGSTASEDTARKARYAFLYKVQKEYRAQAIITAHHQDDVLETAIHNINRGTGPRGLAALSSNGQIIRPLISTTKDEIKAYVAANGLKWHEDSTNSDDSYRRNYIRHQILPRFSAADKKELTERIAAGRELNQKISLLINEFLAENGQNQELRRHPFIMLEHIVAREVMAAWLRQNSIRDFDKKAIERLTHAAKTFHAGKQADVNGQWIIDVKKDYLALVGRER